MNAAEPFRMSTSLNDILPRIKTPPYVSGTPEVAHVYLKETFTTPNSDLVPSIGGGQLSGSQLSQATELHRFLILCSDGLVDLYEDGPAPSDWAGVVGKALLSLNSRSQSDPPLPPSESNPAVSLLRYAFGDDDEVAVSRILTVEMMDRWMDDTTIVVVPL